MKIKPEEVRTIRKVSLTKVTKGTVCTIMGWSDEDQAYIVLEVGKALRNFYMENIVADYRDTCKVNATTPTNENWLTYMSRCVQFINYVEMYG